LLKQGTLETVQTLEWASHIVPVLTNKSIRICGDFKHTVNPVATLDKYTQSQKWKICLPNASCCLSPNFQLSLAVYLMGTQWLKDLAKT